MGWSHGLFPRPADPGIPALLRFKKKKTKNKKKPVQGTLRGRADQRAAPWLLWKEAQKDTWDRLTCTPGRGRWRRGSFAPPVPHSAEAKDGRMPSSPGRPGGVSAEGRVPGAESSQRTACSRHG